MNHWKKSGGRGGGKGRDQKPSKQPNGAPASVFSRILKFEKLNIKCRFSSIVIKVQRALGPCNEWVAEELGPAHTPLCTTRFTTPSLVISIHMFVCPSAKEEYLSQGL